MSPKHARVVARLFRSESVRFEACSGFRGESDPLVCGCGWLEDEHAASAEPASLVFTRRLRPRAVRLAERRASSPVSGSR